MDGEPVARCAAANEASLRLLADHMARDAARLYESDIAPDRHFLMERDLRGPLVIEGDWRTGDGVDRVYINPRLEPGDWEPELATLVIDIETRNEPPEVIAVSLVGFGPLAKNVTEEIHVVGERLDDDPPGLNLHPDEREMLCALARRIREIDPDVLTGWNVVDFDLRVLSERFEAHTLPFNLGRTRDKSWYREGRSWGGSRMMVYGRQVLDALHLVRATLRRYQDYRLGTVAQAILGRGKTMSADDDNDESAPELIERVYREDRAALCEYCLEDSRLVRDILLKEDLIHLSLRRSLLTGQPLARAWGSVAGFEFLYISALRRRGMVAPNVGVDRGTPAGAPGGLVLPAEPGLYRQVLVLDFKSLYPSIIRTFNIDPLSRARGGEDAIEAPNGSRFSREPAIVPEMLDVFFARREAAKREGNELASFTYKIVMNSFYGVMGTEACRFGSGDLAGAITTFGHAILRWTKRLFEDEGHKVIYCDTDSVFVDASMAGDLDSKEADRRGAELCRWTNELLSRHVEETWNVESRLELEFEKRYRRFLLPSVRGDAEVARAKGYAGLRVAADGSERLEIVGMEAVRRDWTDLAHDLQRLLLEQLFHDTPATEMEETIFQWVSDVRAGRKDDDLVYHKGLRKKVAKYTATAPPHVKAARMLKNPSGVIHYVMTTQGPQPLGHVSAALDYGHYIEKQIEPIVQAIAPFCNIDVGAAVRGELSLFRDIGPGG